MTEDTRTEEQKAEDRRKAQLAANVSYYGRAGREGYWRSRGLEACVREIVSLERRLEMLSGKSLLPSPLTWP